MRPPAVGPDGRPLKSKMTAGLPGIFLGSIGVHRFYLGYAGIGIAQIVVTFRDVRHRGHLGLIEGDHDPHGLAQLLHRRRGPSLTD